MCGGGDGGGMVRRTGHFTFHLPCTIDCLSRMSPRQIWSPEKPQCPQMEKKSWGLPLVPQGSEPQR